MSALARHFAHHRIAWSRVVVALVLVVVLFTPPGELSGLTLLPEWVSDVCEVLGYSLVVVATLWRIWCELFIAGTKNGELAGDGPYAIVRNPLYVGSFIGAVGLGCAVQQPLLAVVVGVVFALAYPAVVANEEADLARIFGDRYREYCARVPRWIPDWSLYREPAVVSVPLRQMRRAVLDAMWFLWAFGLWKLIEILHNEHLLPTLF